MPQRVAVTALPALKRRPSLLPRRLDARSWLQEAALAFVLLIAVALRVWPWLKANVWMGVLEYDDGVYYAASRALLHGLAPYRDFTIVHPPLTAVLLLPFAALGSFLGDAAGMAAARAAIVLVACVNVWLVYRLTRIGLGGRSRAAVAASVAAALFYSVFPAAVGAAHTLLLEPLANLFVLVAMLVLLRRNPLSPWAAVAGGALLAAGLGVKAFAGAYVIVGVGWIAVMQVRRAAQFLVGWGAACAVIFLPFVALAGPSTVWRDLVVTQWGRPPDSAGPVSYRLQSLLGLGYLPLVWAEVVVALAVTVGIVLIGVSRRRGVPAARTVWLWLSLTVLIGLSFLQSPSYFDHYADFFAPALAILLGYVLGMAAVAGRTTNAFAVVAVIALLLPTAAESIRADASWPAGASLEQAARGVPQGACVYYDAVSLAIAANRFHAPTANCPAWLDGRGQNLVWAYGAGGRRNFYPAGFLADSRWQQGTQRQLAAAAFLLVRTDPTRTPEWRYALRIYVRQHFHLVWNSHGGVIPSQLWQRNS